MLDPAAVAGWLRGGAELLIENVADIYGLTPERLTELDGFGEISARKLVEAIEES